MACRAVARGPSSPPSPTARQPSLVSRFRAAVRLRFRFAQATPDTLRPEGFSAAAPRVARQGEAWWACLDSNQEPDRYERRTSSRNLSKISVSRSISFTLVRVCSRGFCRITGGMEDRRKPPTGLDRTSPRFVRQQPRGCGPNLLAAAKLSSVPRRGKSRFSRVRRRTGSNGSDH
jgi:hypothetical protein